MVVSLEGEITALNPAAEDLLGIDADELIGRDVSDFFQQENVVETAQNRIREEDVYRGRHQLQTTQGTIIPVSLTASPLNDGSEKARALVLSATEISRGNRIGPKEERLFQVMTEYIEEVVWIFTKDFSELIFVTDAYEDVYGGDLEEAYENPRSFLAYVHPEAREEVKQAIEKLSQGESVELEYRVNPENNYETWVWVQGKPVMDEEGEVELIAGISADITERKQIHRQLEEREQQFRQMAETIDEVHWIANADVSEVLYINPACEDVFGYTQEDFYASVEIFFDGIHPEDQSTVEDVITRVKDGESVHYTYRFERNEGAYIWIEGHADPVYDEDGNIYRITGVNRDITRQKELEQSLRDQRDYFQTIIDSAAQAIFVKNWDGEYQMINDAMADMLDVPKEEAIGKTDAELFGDPDITGQFVEDDRQVLETGEKKKVEERVPNPSTGEMETFFTIKVPLNLDRPPEERVVLGIATNITDRKEMQNRVRSLNEELQEKNRKLQKEIEERKKREDELLKTQKKLEEANNRLEQLSVEDELTGLANRRKFDRTLTSEWALLKRNDMPISLIMIDIDHFKEFNDTYGHPEGDEVLVKVGSLLQDVAKRESDTLARYGGEEFAVILPNTPQEEARELTENIRQHIEDEQIKNKASPTSDHITISAGVCTLEQLRENNHQPDDLVKQADEALYRAKEKGRNRVEVAE